MISTYNILGKMENPLCVTVQRSAGFFYFATVKLGILYFILPIWQGGIRVRHPRKSGPINFHLANWKKLSIMQLLAKANIRVPFPFLGKAGLF
jgi:hypothetical protein